MKAKRTLALLRMIKNITALFVVLLAAGTGLTLYLPQFQPDSNGAGQHIHYQINQDSLKKPLLMSTTLLDPLEQQASGFGLRLGLFSQLAQAIRQGQAYSLAQIPDIVKVTDEQRYWYLLILGPYPSEDLAHQQSFQLEEKHGISTTLIRWPFAEKKAASSETAKVKMPSAP
ncbi:SPOR domain-containing protein [Thalassomonas haliotis]|uniref:SPOR domain-containing protein n=1 Tax=Thalassomonas haliotis TaxID=485448 RepID=A0ABY7VN50_9GAMM|nr:SPOR domain-containing protein [Thalassomonas haliotis]WDE14320.1 SPOR domain-containing protein [Thalassomonas haliotis]